MPEYADKSMMEAYNAQNEGVITRGVQARFFLGPEPDELATNGCNRLCDTQHGHLVSCVVDGCPPNCVLRHQHGKDCAQDCQSSHHTYVCQDKHHVKPAGRPIFKEIVYLKKTVPGDNLNIIVRPLRDGDKDEFRQSWQDFESKTEKPRGTPLDLLPFLNEAQKAEFRAVNCFTAEDIADMSDASAQKFMGIHGIRQKTKDFLAAVSGNAPLQKIREEGDKKIASLEKKLNEMAARLEQAKRG